MRSKISTITASRAALLDNLAQLSPLGLGTAIGSNHANFVMIPVLNRDTRLPDNARSEKVYKALAETEGVVVRFRGKEYGCDGCLRITVGTVEENRIVVEKLREVLQRI